MMRTLLSPWARLLGEHRTPAPCRHDESAHWAKETADRWCTPEYARTVLRHHRKQALTVMRWPR